MTVKYTIPTILQGKKRKTKQMQANEKWYVEFYYNNKRFRKSKGFNRLKDYNEKLRAFSDLRIEYEQLLISGKFQMVENNITVPPVITCAVDSFIQYQKDKGNRLKTIQSYSSKLKYLKIKYGQHLVTEIYSFDVEILLLDLGKNWSPKTFNNAKAIFYNFFEYCIFNRFVQENPVKGIRSRYVPKTKRNRVFNDRDFSLIMDEVKSDRMLELFIKSIYYTCIRPRELMQLQIKNIDFRKNLIFIPANISKNKRDGYVSICENYRYELRNFIGMEPTFFLFSNDCNIFGETPFNVNRPYKRFVKILERLNLKNKGYTLYSFKHYSNVKKYLSGWSLAEIMKANRHSSIEQTETYLKDLTEFVDIQHKNIPKI